MTDTYVSVRTAAKRLSVCEETIRRYVKAGKIAGRRNPGGHFRISAAAIENILTTNATPLDKRHIH